jgi:hypothetical protein
LAAFLYRPWRSQEKWRKAITDGAALYIVVRIIWLFWVIGKTQMKCILLNTGIVNHDELQGGLMA